MNFKNYLRSKQLIIYIQILLNLFIYYYFESSHGDYFTLFTVLVIINFTFCILMLYHYFKFKKLINNLIETERSLDQKFLLIDVQNHYMQYEEKLIYEVLDRVIKNQYEIIKQKNYEIKEEKEFRTIWIHDIKQPLAILKEDNLNKYDRVGAVNQISQKLNYMLYYDKIENIANDLHFTHFNLQSLVNECLKEQAYELIKVDTKIDLQVSENIEVYSDKFWLQFVIEQILSNALKYRNPSNNFELSLAYHDDENFQYLSITDNGIGIPQADLKNVFDKGYRGMNAKEQKLASGLGLYYVKIITKHINVNITINNNENEGVTVQLKFPKINKLND